MQLGICELIVRFCTHPNWEFVPLEVPSGLALGMESGEEDLGKQGRSPDNGWCHG